MDAGCNSWQGENYTEITEKLQANLLIYKWKSVEFGFCDFVIPRGGGDKKEI